MASAETVPSKTSDEIINELVNSMQSDDDGSEDDGHTEEEKEELKEKAKKKHKDKKHKKNKKKKKKHKRSSRSTSREIEENRSHKKRRRSYSSCSDKSDDGKHEKSSKYDNPKRVQRPLSPPRLESNYRRREYSSHDRSDSWHRNGSNDYQHRSNSSHHRHRDRSRSRSRDGRSHSRERVRSRDRSKSKDDPFWESTWEAIEMQKKADDKERKGRHFLEPDRKKAEKAKERSESKDRESSPETEEAKRLKKLKEMSELIVPESEKFVPEPPSSDLFEWDEKTKMRRKKFVPIPPAEDKQSEDTKKIDTKNLTLDEIEEIRRKREKHKQEKERKEKEEGEIESDDEERRRRRRGRSRSRSRSRSPHRYKDRRHSRERYSRDRYSRRHSPVGYRDYRYKRHHDRSRRRSRSHSRDRSDSFRGSRSAIDKAKLLAIAQKNAVKLLNSNDLKGMDKGQLVAIKSGGQSLDELTKFCRVLAKKGITDEFSDDQAGSDSEGEEAKHVNHPFMVRDRAVPNPFMVGLSGLKGSSAGPANGLTFTSMTPAMRDAARSHRLVEFPVSSGNEHRVKEDELDDNVPTGLKAAQNAVVSLAATDDPILKTLKIDPPQVDIVKLPPLPDQLIARKSPDKEKELTEAQKMNLANPLGVMMFGGQVEPPKALPAPQPSVTEAPIEPPKDVQVFQPVNKPNLDISDIISMRLNAMKKLSSHPDDPEALKQLYHAQNEMTSWAASKNKPGQFTGHTGAKVMSKGELLNGMQAWARTEQFTKAQKVSGGFGEYMLRKMGWREGEGLGKDRSGGVDPLQLDIKLDKKGLTSAEENQISRKKRSDVLTLTGVKDLSGKHPVTAVMEVATRKKWGPPNFSQVFECGPPHKKQYIFKCTVNGVDYQPTIASENKKKAKANAATLVLQELGLVPRDPNNPL